MAQRVASLSLDLDNKWSYMKTHGDSGWESYPTYLHIVVPRVLEILKKHNLTITFFVVGQDAAREENYEAIRAIADAGHEIGNHSFNHEPWLHLYSEEQIIQELSDTESAIEAITGKKPIGFRGPGYSLSQTVLKVLHDRGYEYDCSTFPTFLGPLARAYYFMTTDLSDGEKAQRKKLFGGFSEGLRPLKPYKWEINDGTMPEIPVTTMPIFKIPIHLSYILFAAKFSPFLAILYFRIALMLCRLTGIQPSILLHPLDFLELKDAPELEFFPAMQMSLDTKLRVVDKVFTLLKSQYDVVNMREHANRLRLDIPSVVPQFKAVEQT